jgi:hypothetical protein
MAAKILEIEETGHEYQITTMDAAPENKPDITHNITRPLPRSLWDSFDIVLASHVLEHIDRDKLAETFGHLTKPLVNQGEIWVLVPSLEWAAAEVLANRHSCGVEAAIFGGQRGEWDYHRSGFTLRQTRFLFETEGLLVKRAFQAPFVITVGEVSFRAIQNIVIGARYDGLHDPAAAID